MVDETFVARAEIDLFVSRVDPKDSHIELWLPPAFSWLTPLTPRMLLYLNLVAFALLELMKSACSVWDPTGSL